MGMVSGILPVAGAAPFISYGGTAMVTLPGWAPDVDCQGQAVGSKLARTVKCSQVKINLEQL
jgi:hypothetical protein